MRTIKFKARRLDNGEWAKGDLVHSTGYFCIYYESDKYPFGPVVHRVNPDTICQFTGFLDKNGKEIYEGDVLRSDEYPYNYHGKDNYFAEVYWSEYSCGVDLRIQKFPQADVNGDYAGIRESLTLNFARTFEVIGNIHDKEWQEKLNPKSE